MPSPVTLKIKFKSASLQQFIERYAVDVSKGGIFIRTPKPLSVGTTLNFEFHLQDGNPLISGNGTVVWVREPDTTKSPVAPGMGIRFDHLPPDAQKILDQVLARKAAAAEFSEQPTRVAPGGEEERGQEDQGSPAEEVIATPTADADNSALAARAAEEEVVSSKPDALEEEQEEAEKDQDRLEQILFSEGKTSAKEKQAARELRAGDEDLTPVPSAINPALAAGQKEKSSAGLWVVLLLILAVGGAAYYYYWSQRQQVAPPPAVDVTGSSAPDDEPAPAGTPEEAGKQAALKVTSTPAGAKILVDGKDTGKTTPAELTGLDPEEEIEITLDLPGKKLVSSKVKPDREEPLEVALDQPSQQEVRVVSEPPGAGVFVNGAYIGKTPASFKRPIAPGKSYKVLYRLKGYEDVTKEFSSADNWVREAEAEVLQVTAVLEEKDRPQVRPRQPRRPRPQPGAAPQPGTKPEAGDKPAQDTEPAAKPEPEPEPEPAATPKPEAKKAEPTDTPDAKKQENVKKPVWMD